MEKCLLVIYAPPALEETLEDWLLESEAVTGFSTVDAYGHDGQRPSGMSLLEQVTGHQRRVQFNIAASREVAMSLLVHMRERFSGTGLHYMLVPLLESGSL